MTSKTVDNRTKSRRLGLVFIVVGLTCLFFGVGGILDSCWFGMNSEREVAELRPIDYQEVHATLYHNMGIDLHTTQFIDPAGRPQYILDHLDPIKELV